MKAHKIFSWKALLRAPLPIPVAFMVAFVVLTLPAENPGPVGAQLAGYVFLLVVACVISYGAVILLLLPGLWLATRWLAAGAGLAAVVGALSGGVVYFIHLWVWYGASGADSGPPEGSFADFLRAHATPFDWDFAAILAAALITALLYWFFAKPE